MTTRRYKLAPHPIHRGNGRAILREIREFVNGSTAGQVVVVVANVDAWDVREALQRAYENGREDRAGDGGAR